MTVQDLILGALSALGVKAAGDDSANLTDDLNDALPVVNELIETTNIRYGAIYTITPRQLPLAAGINAYTMGAGGTFNYPRPIKIESAGIIQPNGLRSKLNLDTSAQWAAIPDKTAVGKQPLDLYNNNDYPLVTLYLWPAPSGTPKLDLWVWEEFPAAQALTDLLNPPPGDWKYLRYTLAIMLAPAYGLPLESLSGVVKNAQDAVQELFTVNTTDQAASLQPAPPVPTPQ